jgi:DNA (cytosine-5)-methyltransferase 1
VSVSSIVAVDQFCGGGGTSTGLAQVCLERSLTPRLYALNHWPVALATHEKNHPWAVHLSEEMRNLDPLKVVTEGRLDLLVSSPECTYFSIARGGKPSDEQLRSSPYEVVRWMGALRPEAVLVENVPEFRAWGPLDKDGFPIPEKTGVTFRIWIGRMKGLGYSVDYRVLNAADYGGATSRKRLFVIARKGPAPISWPVPSHASRAKPILGRIPWRPAREVIDWTLEGESLFTRRRPLSYATWRRIVVGLERYGGPEVQPFLRTYRKMTGLDDARDSPKNVKGGPQSFIQYMEHSGGTVGSVDDPFKTITTAKGGSFGMVNPFIVRTNFDCWKTQNRMGAAPRPTDEPLQTVTASGPHLALTEPFIVPVVGRRARQGVVPTGVGDPVPTLQTRVGLWLADAVIIPRHGEREGQVSRSHSVDEPMPTVPASGPAMLARGFLVKYYGNGDNVESVDDPFSTLTTHERHALVRPVVIDGKFLDIRLRMIQPHELSGAMGFPKDYEFVGKKTDVVRQIGNAVEVNVARALVSSLLAPAPRNLSSWGA